MFLDRIVASVDARVEALRDEWARLEEKAQNMPPTRSLADALRADPGTLQVIAECKQRSPSKGWLTDHYDPVAQAQGYQRAGRPRYPFSPNRSFLPAILPICGRCGKRYRFRFYVKTSFATRCRLRRRGRPAPMPCY